MNNQTYPKRLQARRNLRLKEALSLENFNKNEIFGTRNFFQNPKLIDVLPYVDFQNRENRQGVVHRNDHFLVVLRVNVG